MNAFRNFTLSVLAAAVCAFASVAHAETNLVTASADGSMVAVASGIETTAPAAKCDMNVDFGINRLSDYCTGKDQKPQEVKCDMNVDFGINRLSDYCLKQQNAEKSK